MTANVITPLFRAHAQPPIDAAEALTRAAEAGAATLDPDQREATRAWLTIHLRVCEDLVGPDRDWWLTYIPGVHTADSWALAVHVVTGRVLNADSDAETATGRWWRESVDEWVERHGSGEAPRLSVVAA